MPSVWIRHISAHTHLGGRLQRPLVLLLYPRVGMHELILLFLLFPSSRPSVARLVTSVPLLLLLHPFHRRGITPFPSFSFSFFALLLLTPYSLGLYYCVVFIDKTPELLPRWSALHCYPDHRPLARAPPPLHAPRLPSSFFSLLLPSSLTSSSSSSSSYIIIIYPHFSSGSAHLPRSLSKVRLVFVFHRSSPPLFSFFLLFPSFFFLLS